MSAPSTTAVRVQPVWIRGVFAVLRDPAGTPIEPTLSRVPGFGSPGGS